MELFREEPVPETEWNAAVDPERGASMEQTGTKWAFMRGEAPSTLLRDGGIGRHEASDSDATVNGHSDRGVRSARLQEHHLREEAAEHVLGGARSETESSQPPMKIAARGRASERLADVEAILHRLRSGQAEEVHRRADRMVVEATVRAEEIRVRTEGALACAQAHLLRLRRACSACLEHVGVVQAEAESLDEELSGLRALLLSVGRQDLELAHSLEEEVRQVRRIEEAAQDSAGRSASEASAEALVRSRVGPAGSTSDDTGRYFPNADSPDLGTTNRVESLRDLERQTVEALARLRRELTGQIVPEAEARIGGSDESPVSRIGSEIAGLPLETRKAVEEELQRLAEAGGAGRPGGDFTVAETPHADEDTVERRGPQPLIGSGGWYAASPAALGLELQPRSGAQPQERVRSGSRRSGGRRFRRG